MNRRTLTRAKFLHVFRWVLPPLLVLNLVVVLRLPLVRPWEEKTDMATANESTNPIEPAQPLASAQSQNKGSGIEATNQNPSPIAPTATSGVNETPTETPDSPKVQIDGDSTKNQIESQPTTASTPNSQPEKSTAAAALGGGSEKSPVEITERLDKKLRLVNPAGNRSKIGFLVDGQEHWLAPGETFQLPTDKERTIVFHRGGAFEEATLVLTQGVFHFEVTKRGWDLLDQRIH